MTCLYRLLTIESAAKLIAVAAALSESEVLASLQPTGRLIGSGLIELNDGPDVLTAKLSLNYKLSELALSPQLDREKIMERFLPTARAPSLAWQDFDHLASGAATVRDLLAAAVRERRPGINILLYGPTGAGKTELARLLSGTLNVPLYVTGHDADEGEASDGYERLTSLRLGNRLIGSTDALLLFDELEDLFEWRFSGLSSKKHGAARMSKEWFNDLLETNAAPTIWVSNEVEGIDRAFLRRFTYALEFPPLSARQRARVLTRHIGTSEFFSSADVDAVAQRFDASPAQLGTAVAAARLLTPVFDRVAVEKLLAPVVKLVTGVDPASQIVFEAGRYQIDALNSPDDLAGIADQLAAWRPGVGLGVSMCLYGPSGTGKSEFVKYLAHRMGRRVVYRRVSDLQSMWVGECEKNIARAFREAEQDDAVLLFDEADTFLRDRQSARQSWEVSQVNEFLQQLELFRGVVACTTNLWRDLDPASLRRFVFKIEFRFLRVEQAVRLFRASFLSNGAEDELDERALGAELVRTPPLSPGDFAAVVRRLRALGQQPTTTEAVALLRAEASARGVVPQRLGFGLWEAQ